MREIFFNEEKKLFYSPHRSLQTQFTVRRSRIALYHGSEKKVHMMWATKLLHQPSHETIAKGLRSHTTATFFPYLNSHLCQKISYETLIHVARREKRIVPLGPDALSVRRGRNEPVKSGDLSFCSASISRNWKSSPKLLTRFTCPVALSFGVDLWCLSRLFTFSLVQIFGDAPSPVAQLSFHGF